MEFNAKADALTRIWEQLNATHRPGRTDGRRTAHKDVLREGWGLSVDVQDMLWETDDRADLLARHNDDFDFLLAPSGLHYVTRYRGPFSNVDQVCGHQALQAADVAEFVMQVERLGFTVDAEPLVAALRPTLLRKKYLTNSELSVVWYKKMRHRCEPLIARVEARRPSTFASTVTHSGYRASALFENDAVVVLRVDAPKKRDRTRAIQAAGVNAIENYTNGRLEILRKSGVRNINHGQIAAEAAQQFAVDPRAMIKGKKLRSEMRGLFQAERGANLRSEGTSAHLAEPRLAALAARKRQK